LILILSPSSAGATKIFLNKAMNRILTWHEMFAEKFRVNKKSSEIIMEKLQGLLVVGKKLLPWFGISRRETEAMQTAFAL
jgi:hypothetical protein